MAAGGFFGRLTWPLLGALISFPWCFGKQIISAVQFWKASKIVSPTKLDGKRQS